VTDKASVIVAEDLTRPIRSTKRYDKNTNRRLSAWTKGVTARALHDVSERRGSVLRLVNAAYTSQVIPGTHLFGRRAGDRLHCPHQGRVVWHADHAAAINVLDRAADPDIGLHTPHTRVKQIIQERADRHRSRLPDQDSNTSTPCRCGERKTPPTINTDQGKREQVPQA
jgi:IS605 OrfB family transposase